VASQSTQWSNKYATKINEKQAVQFIVSLIPHLEAIRK